MVFKYSEIRVISTALRLTLLQNTTIRNNVLYGKNDFVPSAPPARLATEISTKKNHPIHAEPKA
jgi:hypothetical protein|tara:strand:+ start:1042 stop:1233 length:192 start_codon:yes stop_codon:yes gene_type:complete